jgi:hypothetical protein
VAETESTNRFLLWIGVILVAILAITAFFAAGGLSLFCEVPDGPDVTCASPEDDVEGGQSTAGLAINAMSMPRALRS